MSKSLFILGSTGYIGGSVLKGVVNAHPSFSVTALVRNPKDFEAVRAAGVVNIIHGTHDDLDKIRDVAAQSDIVLNAADADDLPLTIAILSGLKIRFKSCGSKPILIHTSGTGVVGDKAEGEFLESGHKIWNDNSDEDIRNIKPEQPHRLIDLEIFQADEQGYCSAYIIAPSTIYGTGLGPVNRVSQQIPTAVQVAVRRKQALYPGKGTNKWNNVHVWDLVDLYILVLNLALSGKDTAKSYGKFYFGSVQEHVWGDIIRQIGIILYDKKVIPTYKAASTTLRDDPPLSGVANNSRSTSERGFALGWRPKAPSIEDTLEGDVSDTLEKYHLG